MAIPSSNDLLMRPMEMLVDGVGENALDILLQQFRREDVQQRIYDISRLYKGELTRLIGLDGQNEVCTRPVQLVVSELNERISTLKSAHGMERALLKEIEALSASIDDIEYELNNKKDPRRLSVSEDGVKAARDALSAAVIEVASAEDDLNFATAVMEHYYSVDARTDTGELAALESYLSKYGTSKSEETYLGAAVLDALQQKYSNDFGLKKNNDGEYVFHTTLVGNVGHVQVAAPRVIDCARDAQKFQTLENFERARYSVQQNVRGYRRQHADARRRQIASEQYVKEREREVLNEQRGINVLERSLSRAKSRLIDASNNYPDRLVSVTEDVSVANIGASNCARQLKAICEFYGVKADVPTFDLARDVPIGDDLYVSRFARGIQAAIYELEAVRSRLVMTYHHVLPQWVHGINEDFATIQLTSNAESGYVSGVLLAGNKAAEVTVVLAQNGGGEDREILLRAYPMPLDPYKLPASTGLFRNSTSASVTFTVRKAPADIIMVLVLRQVLAT